MVWLFLLSSICFQGIYAPRVGSCADSDENCVFWAESGLCDPDKDNGYMRDNCKLSCGLCQDSGKAVDKDYCPNNQVWYGPDSCSPCHVSCKGTVSCECRRSLCACPLYAPVSIGNACVDFTRCEIGYNLCKYKAIRKGRVYPNNDIQPREMFILMCSEGYSVRGKSSATCGYDGQLLRKLGSCVKHVT